MKKLVQSSGSNVGHSSGLGMLRQLRTQGSKQKKETEKNEFLTGPEVAACVRNPFKVPFLATPHLHP